MFLKALKDGVKGGDFTQVKNSYKLSADYKKKATAAAKPKKAPKKKVAPKKKATAPKKKSAPKKKAVSFEFHVIMFFSQDQTMRPRRSHTR